MTRRALSPSQQSILCQIDLMIASGDSSPCFDALAARVGLKRKHVLNQLSKLAWAGYIRWHLAGGKRVGIERLSRS